MLIFGPKKVRIPFTLTISSHFAILFHKLVQSLQLYADYVYISTLFVKVGQYILTLCLGEKILAFCPC